MTEPREPTAGQIMGNIVAAVAGLAFFGYCAAYGDRPIRELGESWLAIAALFLAAGAYLRTVD